MGYVVVDTDVCSFFFKKNTRQERYRPHLIGHTLCLSFQTVGELYQWAETNNWGVPRRASMELWLRNYVILPYDNDTARAWAQIRAERKHQTISAQDAWVAACALRHNCPLITHNANHFAGITGLTIISEPDPMTAAPAPKTAKKGRRIL